MKNLFLALLLLLTPVMAGATVPEITARHDYTGNAATTVFAYTFKIVDKLHLRVLVGGVVKTVDTDYTVAGVNADGGGSITFTTAPASGAGVVILRDQPIDQTTTYQPGGGFPATRVERDLDRGVMVDQMLQEQINRSLRYPETYNPAAALTTVPVPVPNKCLGWNAAGVMAANDCTGDSSGAVTAVLIDSTALSTSNAINFQDTATIDFTNPSGSNVQAAVKAGGIGTAQIADDAVTFAKQQNVSAASRLIGRGSAAGAGNPEEISLGTGLIMTGTTMGIDLAFSQLTGAASDAQIPDLNTLGTGLAASKCVETDITGKFTVSATACSSGAGTGDIEGVTAGVGISGGGNSGTVTVNWAPGTYVSNITLWDSSQSSRTLTAGLSGGSDPVFTFSNNRIEVTLGQLVPGVGATIQANAYEQANISVLSGLSTLGFPAYVGAGSYFTSRTMTGVTGEISITNPAGTAGNPLFGIADAFTLAGKTSTIPWKTGTTAPVTCSAGMAFFDTDATAGTNLNLCTATDTWTQISGSGSGTGHTIQEEGGALTARTGLNFIGGAITAADDSGNNRTNVTLSQSPAGSGSVVGTGRTVSTTAPLGGGGALSADLTLTCTTCATASGAAAGQVAVFTSATALDSYANLGFDGTDLTIGTVSANYVRMVTASLTGARTLTFPDANSVTVIPTTATSNQFLTHVTSGGVQTKAQPAFSDLSGVNTVAKGGTSISTIPANSLLGSVGIDTIQAITVGSGLTLAAGTLSATGGAGTPGGANTQLQFNDSGAFLGTLDFTVDKTNVTMSIGVEVVDYANSPLLTLDHDGTWGIVSTAGTGTGAANVGLKLTTEGTGKIRVGSLATTGAATGKTVVCADANGDLYRSSTGTDCSN